MTSAFSDGSIIMSTIEMEVLLWFLYEELGLADYVILKDIEQF